MFGIESTVINQFNTILQGDLKSGRGDKYAVGSSLLMHFREAAELLSLVLLHQHALFVGL